MRRFGDPSFLPENAKTAARRYKRHPGLRCDKKFVIRHMVIGDDPLRIPFGSAPDGIRVDFGLNNFESAQSADNIITARSRPRARALS